MKLIVCFSTGDGYTWSQDHVYPVECESAEKLLVDFENEVHRAAKDYEVERKESEAWSNALAVLHRKKNPTEEDYENLSKLRSGPFDSKVHFLDEEWSLDTFYEFETKQVIPGVVDIYTLDEWFDANVIKA